MRGRCVCIIVTDYGDSRYVCVTVRNAGMSALCFDFSQVINHKDYKSRDEFDAAMNDSLMAAGIEIVCLAGFMRILTGEYWIE